jgi:hypothetical protein
MRILILQDGLYEYLAHVVKAYANGGIDPEEGQALYFLDKAVNGAQKVDEGSAARINLSLAGDAGTTTGKAVEEGLRPPGQPVHPEPDEGPPDQ